MTRRASKDEELRRREALRLGLEVRLEIARPWMVGSLVGLASLPKVFFSSHDDSVMAAALSLPLIAGIYVGFALRDGRVKSVVMEVIVAWLLFQAATIGLTEWEWAIPLALALHGVWGIAHHRWIETEMPRWYIQACAIYDWIAAVGITLIWLYR